MSSKNNNSATQIHIANESDAASHWGTILYVIGPNRGPVKIGISGSAEARLADLQTGHPYELTILAQVNVPHDGKEAEQTIHQFLAPYRVRPNGEWFHRTKEVVRLIAMMQSRLSPNLIMANLKSERAADWEKNRATWAASRTYQRRKGAVANESGPRP